MSTPKSIDDIPDLINDLRLTVAALLDERDYARVVMMVIRDHLEANGLKTPEDHNVWSLCEEALCRLKSRTPESP